MRYPERIVPDETEGGVVALHLKRYAFAREWADGHVVLDVGCGVGYGAAFLAETATRVVGGDVDAETIAYARSRYDAPNVEFLEFDAQSLPFGEGSFDTVCAFEVIEHIERPDALVREAARVLRRGGTFLVSTPRAERTTHTPDNPFHRVEFSRDDFEALLESEFATVKMYGERRRQTRLHRALQRLDILGLRRRSAVLRRASALTGTPAIAHLTLDDLVISRDAVDRAETFYAVCTMRS